MAGSTLFLSPLRVDQSWDWPLAGDIVLVMPRPKTGITGPVAAKLEYTTDGFGNSYPKRWQILAPRESIRDSGDVERKFVVSFTLELSEVIGFTGVRCDAFDQGVTADLNAEGLPGRSFTPEPPPEQPPSRNGGESMHEGESDTSGTVLGVDDDVPF